MLLWNFRTPEIKRKGQEFHERKIKKYISGIRWQISQEQQRKLGENSKILKIIREYIISKKELYPHKT